MPGGSDDLDVLAPSPYVTAGERLLGFLRTNVLADLHAADLTARLTAISTAVERGSFFTTAIQEIVGLNVVARLTSAGRWAADNLDGIESPLADSYIRSAILNELLVDYSEIGKVSDYLIEAVRASRQPLGDALRSDVFAMHGLTCYVCGRKLIRGGDEAATATVEHVWPRTLGGGSDFRNLLPACRACNSTRGDAALWPAFWFQALLLGPRPSETAVETHLGTRARVGLQYFRAHEVVAGSGVSFKRAMLLVGPLPDPDVSERSFPSDFFTILEPVDKVTP